MIKEQKKQIRRKALACRNALTEPERERGKLLITERILGHQWYYLSDTILGFVSYGSEICTTEILESALQDGKNVYVPKVEDGKMEFYRMFSLSELKNGYKKIPEPAGDTDRYVFEPEHADKTLLLMPGSAFDPLGNRMGYGNSDHYCKQQTCHYVHSHRYPSRPQIKSEALFRISWWLQIR
nr:5-formyltetrahydrofolate cyclo-ligase [uncultured Marvinbryantia sp.]